MGIFERVLDSCKSINRFLNNQRKVLIAKFSKSYYNKNHIALICFVFSIVTNHDDVDHYRNIETNVILLQYENLIKNLIEIKYRTTFTFY